MEEVNILEKEVALQKHRSTEKDHQIMELKSSLESKTSIKDLCTSFEVLSI